LSNILGIKYLMFCSRCKYFTLPKEEATLRGIGKKEWGTGGKWDRGTRKTGTRGQTFKGTGGKGNRGTGRQKGAKGQMDRGTRRHGIRITGEKRT
jgi:hypothetical protein